MKTPLSPVLHWSDTGVASWFYVSLAAGELGLELGLLKGATKVSPIQTSDYTTPATQPEYSLLECNNTRSALGLGGQHWRQALRAVEAIVN